MLASRTTAEPFQFSATPSEGATPGAAEACAEPKRIRSPASIRARRGGLGDLAPSAPIVVLGFATGIALGTVLLMLPVA